MSDSQKPRPDPYRIFYEAVKSADLSSGDSVMTALLDALIRLTESDRGAVFLMEEGEPVPRLCRDSAGRGAEPFALPTRVLARIREERRAFASVDVKSEEQDLYPGTLERLGIRSLILTPWIRDGDLLGVCYVDRKAAAGDFSDEIVGSFEQFGGDLFNLLHLACERERIAHELDERELWEPIGEVQTRSPVLCKNSADASKRVPLRGEASALCTGEAKASA